MVTQAQDPSQEPGLRVRALAEHGSNIVVDGSVPIRRYFRSGQEMLRMANIYYEEKNWESAFILYSKYMTIFVEKLPKHPHYKTARPEDLKNTKKNLRSAFPNAEDTKKKLREKFAEEHKIWQVQEEAKLAEEAQRQAEEARRSEEERTRQEEADAALAEDQRRRMTEQERSAIDQQQRELDNQKAALMQAKKAEDLRREQERQAEANRRLAGSVAMPFAAGAAAAAAGVGAAGAMPPPPSYDAVSQGYGIQPPQVLPSAPMDPLPPRAPMPSVDRSLKIDRSNKPAQMLGIASTTTNKHGLRNLFIPGDTMMQFLKLANNNTLKNLETCGILAGKLAKDAFTITHIIVPKQTSTSDSCTALNEEEIFDFVDNNDLITLGWIHTHPTQTAFMSSIDLHTHCPYQIMMPEAIAIVCAPKHNQTGFFSLTPDYGIQFIATCKLKGFHPHPSQPPIYEEGAHCKLKNDIPSIRIGDLR